jgi:arylsulfatase A-like enzyme
VLGWALALSGAACDGRATPAVAARPPIVLITADGLRADHVGRLGGLPGLTPHLDRFLAGADLAGAAVAASSDPAPASLSLQTGLLPSQLRLGPDLALPQERETLAEALARIGYRTVAFVGGSWADPRKGHGAGFGAWRDLGPGRDALRFLRQLDDGPVFVWIDLDVPAPPLRLYPALASRWRALGRPVDVESLPARVGSAEIAEALARPGGPSRSERETWSSLFCLNVARADMRIGELLEALEASGAGSSAIVVVASTRGENAGDAVATDSRAATRGWIEVPLGIRFGAGQQPRSDEPGRGLLAIPAVHATLVEAAGGTPLPATVPVLRRASQAVLSELSTAAGQPALSLVSLAESGREQVVAFGDYDALGEAADGAAAAPRLEGWLWLDGRETPLPAARTADLGRELSHTWRVLRGDAPRAPRPLRLETPASRLAAGRRDVD